MTDSWTVPAPLATLQASMHDGTLVNVRRHGNPEGPRIVLSHGNGFAADMYYPYWSLLTERFDVFVYDFRSHGWNPVGALRVHNIPTFVQDCESVLRDIGRFFAEKPAIGVFHSMSAVTALLHAQGGGGFSGLVLFDPPVCPPGGAPEDLEKTVTQQMASTARRRRDRFESREDYASRLGQSPAFQRMRPGVAELIGQTTLRPAADGDGYELCCPREHEAQVYEYFFGWAMQVDIKSIECPVKVIGSDPTEKFSFMPSMDLSALIDLDYDFLPETTHFLQLEAPEQCAALTVEYLEGQGLI
jgi:pimeloyl-ACP methyl ester carboxylesterase